MKKFSPGNIKEQIQHGVFLTTGIQDDPIISNTLLELYRQSEEDFKKKNFFSIYTCSIYTFL